MVMVWLPADMATGSPQPGLGASVQCNTACSHHCVLRTQRINPPPFISTRYCSGWPYPEIPMTTYSALFQPLTVGPLTVPNRIAMAPLTRNRAAAGGVPGPLAALYYRQRASVCLRDRQSTRLNP